MTSPTLTPEEERAAREAFEAWARKAGHSVVKNPTRDGRTSYHYLPAATAWPAWLAAREHYGGGKR